VLERAGFKVLAASGAEQAVTMCRDSREQVDLLLSDVVLQTSNGREVAEKLLRLCPKMKIIFMSGYTDDAVLRHGISNADAHFIQKPFTPDALLTKIRSVLKPETGASGAARSTLA